MWLCVKSYSYKLLPTVHEILCHGTDIIWYLGLPIGKFCEEPQEANDRISRKAKLEHSKINNRVKTNEDMLHYSLVNSDPVISYFRTKEKRKNSALS